MRFSPGILATRRDWELPERLATPEDVYCNRRSFLRAMGFTGAGLGALGGLARRIAAREGEEEKKEKKGGGVGSASPDPGRERPARPYPAKRNADYGEKQLLREITSEEVATSYNNFYEFSFYKSRPKFLAQKLTIDPWKVEIAGAVKKARTLDLEDILKMVSLEERLYRFRCVEAWSMAVPWTGFPLKTFIEALEPLSSARYVRFVTFLRPQEAPNQRQDDYPWPYFEGLRMDEAMNELTLLATGLYGKPLPKQNGAPIRLVVPWKYGYKSIKSIVRIEFTEKRPATFWNTLLPEEYGFLANVEPTVPHPRWSQATERIVETGERVPTLPYNGYAKQVARLYKLSSS